MRKPDFHLINLTSDEALVAIVALRTMKSSRRNEDLARSLSDRLARSVGPSIKGRRAPISRVAFDSEGERHELRELP